MWPNIHYLTIPVGTLIFIFSTVKLHSLPGSENLESSLDKRAFRGAWQRSSFKGWQAICWRPRICLRLNKPLKEAATLDLDLADIKSGFRVSFEKRSAPQFSSRSVTEGNQEEHWKKKKIVLIIFTQKIIPRTIKKIVVSSSSSALSASAYWVAFNIMGSRHTRLS